MPSTPSLSLLSNFFLKLSSIALLPRIRRTAVVLLSAGFKQVYRRAAQAVIVIPF